jgi:hypothetical protein
VTTFKVDANWYGAGDSQSWGIGKGLDRVKQQYAVGGIYVETLKLSVVKAVAKFRALKSLVAGPATQTRVGGYRGVTFHAKVKGEHAPLTALGSTSDIPGDVPGQQTFLNVRGKTLLIRTESKAESRTAAAAVRSVLRTFRFVR